MATAETTKHRPGPVVPPHPDYWEVREQLQAARNAVGLWKCLTWVFAIGAALLFTTGWVLM